MGQDNITLGKICKDKSCFVIKDIERKDLDAIMILPKKDLVMKQTAIAFVDDTSFVSTGNNCKNKMQ